MGGEPAYRLKLSSWVHFPAPPPTPRTDLAAGAFHFSPGLSPRLQIEMIARPSSPAYLRAFAKAWAGGSSRAASEALGADSSAASHPF